MREKRRWAGLAVASVLMAGGIYLGDPLGISAVRWWAGFAIWLIGVALASSLAHKVWDPRP